MAHYHQQFGNLEAELRATRRALELRPNYADAIRRLSRLEAQHGRHDRALCLARRAVEVEPTDHRLYARLAFAYRDLGLWAEAERTHQRRLDLRLAPDYDESIRLSLVQGDRRRALEYYRAFRTRMDSSTEALDHLGEIEFQLGWIDSALVHFRASEEADPGGDLRRAWVYWESGERKLAERHLRGQAALARQQLEEGWQTIWPYVMRMFVHTIRGEEEKAVDVLASATDRNFLPYPWFDFFAELERTRERLRDNEQFREILRDLEARTDSLRAEAERRGCVR